jgi:hypothetical protein
MFGILHKPVGRTPWSARVPLDPLFAHPKQPHAIPERPPRGYLRTRACRWPLKISLHQWNRQRFADMWDRPPGLSSGLTLRYSF